MGGLGWKAGVVRSIFDLPPPEHPGATMNAATIRPLLLLAPLALGGCVAATAVPVAVPMVAYPGPEKAPALFQADDTACRLEAERGAVASAPAGPGGAASTLGGAPAVAGPNAGAVMAPPPADPAALYLGCMAARGNTVAPAATPTASYGVPYAVYGRPFLYPDPWVYGGPWPYGYGGYGWSGYGFGYGLGFGYGFGGRYGGYRGFGYRGPRYYGVARGGPSYGPGYGGGWRGGGWHGGSYRGGGGPGRR